MKGKSPADAISQGEKCTDLTEVAKKEEQLLVFYACPQEIAITVGSV